MGVEAPAEERPQEGGLAGGDRGPAGGEAQAEEEVVFRIENYD